MDCLSDQQLSRILMDSGAEPDPAWVQHLDQCARCQTRLESLAGGSDFPATIAADSWVTLDVAEMARYRALRKAPMPRAERSEEADADDSANSELASLLTPSDRSDYIGCFGRFDVRAQIGHGGMGIVLKAHDRKLDRDVAVKILAPALAGNRTARQRFLREARAAARVENDYVVAVHEVDQHGGYPYLVMPFIDGESLAQRVRRKGPLDTDEVARLARHAARALTAAHRARLVHRDIKPGNLLFEFKTGRYKVADFGLARAAEDPSLTRSGLIAGTPHYMAPEQAAGHTIDHRADLYSLGAVLFFACTGRAPFDGATALAVMHQVTHQAPPDVRTINPDVPDWLGALIQRLMAKTPDQRPRSAVEVLSACGTGRRSSRHHHFVVHEAKPAPSSSQPKSWRRLFGMAALSLVVLVGLLVVSSRWPRHDTNRGNGHRAADTHEIEPQHQSAALEGSADAPDRVAALIQVQTQGRTWIAATSLSDAIKRAPDGGTIEIGGPATVEVGSPVDTQGKQLTIRAAEGTAPIVKLTRRSDPDAPARIIVTGPLHLAGLTLQYAADAAPRTGPDSILMVQRSALVCNNCRFELVQSEGPRASCVLADESDVELRNCMITCSSRGSGIMVVPAGRATTTVSNSIIVAENCLTICRPLLRVRQDQPIIKMQHVTLIGASGVRLWNRNPPRPAIGRTLGVELKQCLFDVGHVCTASLTSMGKPLGAELIALEQLNKTVRWTGDENFFSVRRSYCGMAWGSRTGASIRSGPQSLANWRQFCVREGPGSVEGKLVFEGAPAGILAPSDRRWTPADCRYTIQSPADLATGTTVHFGAETQSVGVCR